MSGGLELAGLVKAIKRQRAHFRRHSKEYYQQGL